VVPVPAGAAAPGTPSPAPAAPAGAIPGGGAGGTGGGAGGTDGGGAGAGGTGGGGGPFPGSLGGGRSAPGVSPGAFDSLPAAAPRRPARRPARRDRTRTVTRTVIHTVRDAVEVIPPFVWALIAGLAVLCLAAAAASSLLAGRARGLARQRAALLEDVGLLQSALLPAAPAQVPGAVASAAYLPAAGPRAGGDFHDVFAIDDTRLGLVVGRVSAHGRRALGATAHIRHVLRAYLEGGLQPRNALHVGGDVLGRHLGADYACVTVAVYDSTSSELTYASAGMPAPVVHGSAGFEPVTALAPPPIGMGIPTGTRQTTAVLPPGAIAAFFTDGLLDAAPHGRRTGYRGAWHAVAALGRGDATALVHSVAAGARPPEPAAAADPEGPRPEGVTDSGIAGLADDVAAVVLRVGEGAPLAGPEGERRTEELELTAADLRGERAGLFLRDCGVPTDRIDPIVADLRETGRRLGGAVLRVRIGPGLPEAETALRDMDVLHAPHA
jgi:hypothetical protein